MKLLRNEEFQKLLLEYKRAYVPFLIGYEVLDSVSSKKLDRFGKYETAEGYLDACSRLLARALPANPFPKIPPTNRQKNC